MAWSRQHVFALKRYDEALAEYQKGLSINHDLAEGWLGLGNTYFELKRYDEALAAYNKALAVKSDFTEGWLGRANLFQELRKHDEAARDYAKVLDIDPSFPFAKGRLLHQKMLICDWHEVKSLIEETEVDVASGKLSAEPFGWQGVTKSERSLQLCANLFNESEFPVTHLKRNRETALVKKTEKIRVGYLSGEFREQATSHLFVGVLENHDHSKFDIYAFDNGWDDKSEIRQRINASVLNIIDVSRLSDLSARDVIGDNRIDILVNLNGYFGRHRNGVFAQRASIQVNYLGYPGTLGATYMDYIIADEHVIPENNKVFYNEKVVYLPNSYQANDQKKKSVPASSVEQNAGCPRWALYSAALIIATKSLPTSLIAGFGFSKGLREACFGYLRAT
jgi:protein O-GlcNAc transferase